MSAFKHKTTKQTLMDDKNITTLDSVHKEKQAEFNYIKTVIIPKLKSEYKEIKQQLKTSDIGIEARLEKNDRAIEISASIREYKNRITDYYLKNNKYIFSYFETKKDISNAPANHGKLAAANARSATMATSSGPAATAAAPANKSQLINSFFKVPPNGETVATALDPSASRDNQSSPLAATAAAATAVCSSDQDKMNFTKEKP